MKKYTSLKSHILNEEIPEDSIHEENSRRILAKWLKERGRVRSFYRCVGSEGSGSSLYFTITCHHTLYLTLGWVN